MSINIPKLSVYTTEQGIKTINQNLGSLKNWRELIELKELISKAQIFKNIKS